MVRAHFLYFNVSECRAYVLFNILVITGVCRRAYACILVSVLTFGALATYASSGKPHIVIEWWTYEEYKQYPLNVPAFHYTDLKQLLGGAVLTFLLKKSLMQSFLYF